MVEIRVAVPDATRVHGLNRRLAEQFDRSSVSFDGAHREVRIRSEWESRGVVQVLRAVESWLAEDGPDSAKLSIGDRSYTMIGPTGLAAPADERLDRTHPTAHRADDRCQLGNDPGRAQARAAPAPQSAPQVSVLRPSDHGPTCKHCSGNTR
jgi:hypothetical protein